MCSDRYEVFQYPQYDDNVTSCDRNAEIIYVEFRHRSLCKIQAAESKMQWEVSRRAQRVGETCYEADSTDRKPRPSSVISQIVRRVIFCFCPSASFSFYCQTNSRVSVLRLHIFLCLTPFFSLLFSFLLFSSFSYHPLPELVFPDRRQRFIRYRIRIRCREWILLFQKLIIKILTICTSVL